MKKFYIYRITNTISSKQYVGSRLLDVNSPELDPYMGSGKLLKEDYQKYGMDIFKKEILEIGELSNKEILEIESQYIIKSNSLYPLGYNLVLPNQYPNFNMRGRKMSERSKKLISKAVKKFRHTEETKERIRKSVTGFKLSEEAKEKIKGPKSIESRKKMSKSHTGKKLSEETKDKIRKARLGKKFPRK